MTDLPASEYPYIGVGAVPGSKKPCLYLCSKTTVWVLAEFLDDDTATLFMGAEPEFNHKAVKRLVKALQDKPL